MKRQIIALLIALAIGLVIFFLINEDDGSKVCFDDNCFVVEVVDTQAEREKGLMYRESLDRKAGMLFIFEEEGNYPFWMKNTLIPLDIIWIGSDGIVVDIKTAVPCESDPCPITGHEGAALYVLEINAGLANELGIEIGQIAKSNLIKDE
jgi:uncharacterized protein